MTTRISGFFLIAFMLLAFCMAILYVGTAYKKTEMPKLETLWVGKWTPEFEKALNEVLPIESISRSFWGGLEFSLFSQGRKGVLVGENGWLFTDEEFSCLPNTKLNIKNNLEYIQSVYDNFKNRDIELVIAVIPAKARFLSRHIGTNIMPACRQSIYEDTVNAITLMGIRTQGLLTAMETAPDKDKLFLKTDTHWTPEGARLAAVALAETMKEYQFPKKEFKTALSEDKTHDGDLLRYLPGVSSDKISRDNLSIYKTDAIVKADEAADLFSQDIPPITLVGTSYSANPNWNFAGFLKEFLKTDILNAADEGQGPFTVMEKYLHSKTLEETPPAVVVWEIPERYMTMVPDFGKK